MSVSTSSGYSPDTLTQRDRNLRDDSSLLSDTIADLGVSDEKGRRKKTTGALRRSPKYSPTGYFQEH